MKIKTFTQSLKIFHTKKEIETLDAQVNEFLATGSRRLISVSDTTTAGEGDTIGIIRVVAYED